MGSNHMHDLFRRSFKREDPEINKQDNPLFNEETGEINLSGETPQINEDIWIDNK